jgi:hypothetical protein
MSVDDWEREATFRERDANFRELSTTARHYSNLRFLITPFYVALNGGLLLGIRQYIFEVKDVGLSATTKAIVALGLLALASIVFLVFRYIENTLNLYVDFFRGEFKEKYPNSFWSGIPHTGQGIHHCVMLLYWSIFLGWCAIVSLHVWQLLPAHAQEAIKGILGYG